jgi:hypothetical protein
MFRDSSSSRTMLRHPLPQIIRKGGVETYTISPSMERRALTVALNPSAVDGITINFSALS